MSFCLQQPVGRRPNGPPVEPSENTTSHPVPATLYRIAAVAGCGSAAIVLVNAAKRAEVIPTSAFTQLVAPLAQILALALVTALYSPSVAARASSASSLTC